MLKPKCISIFALALIPLFPQTTWAGPIVFSASGANAAAIQGAVDAFRAALGNPNNGNAPGPLFDGRREINWDGGGAATSPVATPFNGFLNNRGASFTTPGTGFVQAPPTGGPGGGLATHFSNPTYGTIFTTFSAQRLFTPDGSNITDAEFFIPGTNGGVPKVTAGFGAVFSDVDLAGTTSIEYFNESGGSLGTFFAPIADNGLSFLGVLFTEGSVIDRVRIITGNSPLGPNDGGGVDVVAMDDFIYAEPVPEPSTLALLSLGLGGVLVAYRRRKM